MTTPENGTVLWRLAELERKVAVLENRLWLIVIGVGGTFAVSTLNLVLNHSGAAK